MSQTEQNLKDAFAGESQANRKYTAFAKKADDEGFPGIAKLFRTVAFAETVHALRELKDMGGVKDTASNLQAAIDGETYEYTDMYVKFLDAATKEGVAAAVKTFEWAKKVEEVHAQWYKKALEAVKEGKDLRPKKLWVCQECGNVIEGDLPEKCPVCAHAKEFYIRLD